MSKAKASSTSNSTDNDIQILKEATCPTSSGKSTLTYQVGKDESDTVFLKITGNNGGGFWSAEWVSHASVEQAISEWPADQGITSMAFRKIFRGKSANTPGFLVAVLCAEGLLEPMGDRKRVHQACDPAAFLESLEGQPQATGKKPATKAKASAKAKAAPKAKSPAKAKAKTTRKSVEKSPKNP